MTTKKGKVNMKTTECVGVNVDEFVSRRFRRKGGFEDETDFVEIKNNNKCLLHYKGGAKQAANGSYTLKICLDYVVAGIWDELVC